MASTIAAQPGSIFPCIAAARSFDASSHLPFLIGNTRVGWLRRHDAARLSRWHDVFDQHNDRVVLAPRLDSVLARSQALGAVIETLAEEGALTGWRNETYAVRNQFDDPPLAFIERAAARYFGTMTYAVHVNGIAALDAAARPSALWIAQRSLTKSTDPGMLDSLVGGGIGWGLGVRDTLLKESWEESGIPAELAGQSSAGRCAHVLCEIEQGTQAEQLFIFDWLAPPGFVPVNQDGEVAAHQVMSIARTLEQLRRGAITVDASIATLDCLLRHGLIAAADCPGFDGLLVEPHESDALNAGAGGAVAATPAGVRRPA